MFAPDELIAALADAGVDYVLIGGLAVGDRAASARVRSLTRRADGVDRLGEEPGRGIDARARSSIGGDREAR